MAGLITAHAHTSADTNHPSNGIRSKSQVDLSRSQGFMAEPHLQLVERHAVSHHVLGEIMAQGVGPTRLP